MMRTRNILVMSTALMAMALTMSSCGASLTLALGGNSGAAAYVDDLYGVHDVAALREAERIAAEKEAAARAEREKRIAAMIAADNAEADIDEILGGLGVESAAAGIVMPSGGGDVNITYNNIYVDDYASAYARRLQGFSSLTYRLPSSYWDFRYGDAYFLTLAYDPAFYTVMVMGDQVWVEPRYITNMFGSWNNPYYYGYRYGYNPYYYGYSYAYWDYWGWNSPYWACDPFYHYHYHGWYDPYYGYPHYGYPHYPHHKPGGPGGPHGDGGHKKPNVTHRPSYGTGSGAGGGSSMRPGGGVLSYNDRLGGRDESRGGTQIATGTSGTTNRGSASVNGSSVRPVRGTVAELRNGISNSTTTRAEGGKVSKPISKNELSGTLSGSTIANRPNGMRGNTTSGVSNSSSRSSRGTSATVRGGSNTSSPKKSSSVSSGNRPSSSNRSSSSVSRSSSSSSRSSSSSSSSTSRSSFSSSRSGSSSFSGGGSSSSRSSSSRSGR